MAGESPLTPANIPVTNPIINSCLTTGLETTTATTNEQISVYPNPISSKIAIVNDGSSQTIQVFNAFGSLIQTVTIENDKTEIDLSNQSSGVYFLRIGNYSKKVIKE